jgi:hypothetical protein
LTIVEGFPYYYGVPAKAEGAKGGGSKEEVRILMELGQCTWAYDLTKIGGAAIYLV